MACNENIVKNIANEITRNCQVQNVTVDIEFVVYLVDLFLLNPKYGKLFSKTINRNNLQYFVEECVHLLTRGETSLNTLRMQHIIQTNYDKLQNLIEKHLHSISTCLRPLVSEILDAEPAADDEAECRKLFRKISIYIVLASGLGNPGVITTLKEGMAALESVFSLEDLKMFVAIPRTEKMAQLEELTQIVSGVRLFNRDCKKGGEGIPDLPFNLVDAGKACLGSLSNALIAVMQRVNALTTAVADVVAVQHETGNVYVDIPSGSHLTLEDYIQIFQLLAFNRQYELFVRKLLSDVETMVDNSITLVDRAKGVLEELHAAVKYKAAVPVITVFPLFTRLWQVWRAMQNIMFLVSTVNRLMSTLAAIQDQMKMPTHVLDAMLRGKQKTQILPPADTGFLNHPGYVLEESFKAKAGVCLYVRADVCCRRLRSLEDPSFSMLEPTQDPDIPSQVPSLTGPSAHDPSTGLQVCGARSTTRCGVLHLLDIIMEAWEKSQHVLGVFCDLSKAFDCVEHQTLVLKLNHYGIKGAAQNFATIVSQFQSFKL
ncbi:hypothetical protein evm_013195 [Chilo suppressalis]|nr:hypothetical protein evm_013195 [Chilo suppressalis]